MNPIRCPKCNEDGHLTIDFISAGYPVMSDTGDLSWDFDESPEPVYDTIYCMNCGNEDMTEEEIYEYNIKRKETKK